MSKASSVTKATRHSQRRALSIEGPTFPKALAAIELVPSHRSATGYQMTTTRSRPSVIKHGKMTRMFEKKKMADKPDKPGRTYVVAEHVLLGADFDRVSDEAKDGADPQEHGKSAEEVLAELDPFRRRLWWSQGVGAVAFKDGLSLRCCQALQSDPIRWKSIQTRKKKIIRQRHNFPSNYLDYTAPQGLRPLVG